MHFIQSLRFIIFAFLISNIVKSSENSSLRIDKNIKIDTKKNIYNNTSDNNINDGPLTTENLDENLRTKERSRERRNLAIILILISSLILIYVCLYPWVHYRCKCNIQYIRRNCLRFRERCVWYIRNFPNTDFPEVPSRIVRQPEPDDYRDIYEMSNFRIERLSNMRATI